MTDSSFIIFLDDVRMYGCIGVGEQERRVGNEFRVSVAVRYDASRFVPESLESSISYAEIYDEIKSVMKGEWKLLESVALAISERISNRWDYAEEITTRIVKDKAPVSGIAGDCGVEYFWKKN